MVSSPAEILIVEDEELSRDMLLHGLTAHGVVARCAVDGAGCMAELEARPADLVLLDLMLPGVSGMEVLRQIRRRWPQDELPVIMVTARRETQDVVAALEAGANDYVGKPLNLPVLLARVQTCLKLRSLSAHSRHREELERRVEQRTAELRRSNEALRESEQRFRLMADSATVLLWIDAPDGLCQFVNKSWLEFTGRTREQELGWGWLEGIHPDDRQRCIDQFSAASAARRPLEIEYRLRRHDGEYRWIFDSSAPRFTASGEFVGCIGSGIDITERRRMEQLLRETHSDLERRVGERTTELAKSNALLLEEVAERRLANHRLLAYQAKLRALGAQLALAEEQERRRIARGLHDEIGQSLALAKIRLASLRNCCADTEIARDTVELAAALEKAITHIRSLTFELGSRILYEFGLEAALESLLEPVQQHGIAAHFEDDRQPKPLDEDVRVIVFQAAREVIHNVMKHAHAKNLWLSIARVDEMLRVEVRDDGVGYDPRQLGTYLAKSGGFGLFNVRERLAHVEGALEIHAAPGEGSRVVLFAPLKHSSPPSAQGADQAAMQAAG